MLDRMQMLPGKQLGKQAHHHFAVLEHVRHAGGRSQVVLQHVVLGVLVAHEVDAGNMRVHLVGQFEAEHRHLISLVRQHLLGRDHARLEDLLPVVDVVQEAVERGHALHQPGGELVPLSPRDDARDGVERNEALGARLVAVHGERDADAMEQEVGFAALLGDAVRRSLREPVGEGAKMRTHFTVCRTHFVVVLTLQRDLSLEHTNLEHTKQPACRTMPALPIKGLAYCRRAPRTSAVPQLDESSGGGSLPRALRRYSDGGTPTWLRKKRVKLLCAEKPSSADTSEILPWPEDRREMAVSTHSMSR